MITVKTASGSGGHRRLSRRSPGKSGRSTIRPSSARSRLPICWRTFQSREAVNRGGYTKGLCLHHRVLWAASRAATARCGSIPDALFLSKLYVRASFRGKGLARAMLKAAEKAARESGVARIRLTCNKYNTASLAAYERMGFVRTADVVTDIGGGFVMDDYVMEKQLD